MTNNLRRVRLEKGLAMWGLAVKAKVSTATLTGIEKWDYMPKQSTRERIASALQVSPGDIWPSIEKTDQVQTQEDGL